MDASNNSDQKNHFPVGQYGLGILYHRFTRAYLARKKYTYTKVKKLNYLIVRYLQGNQIQISIHHPIPTVYFARSYLKTAELFWNLGQVNKLTEVLEHRIPCIDSDTC